jgi:toxin ParE1/3/4
MPYRTTPLADTDIIDLYVYGARHFGAAQAELYFADLARCFDLLAERPLIARERRDLNPPVRVHFHHAHVIAYLVMADEILIVRVLDARQDWAEYLRSPADFP